MAIPTRANRPWADLISKFIPGATVDPDTYEILGLPAVYEPTLGVAQNTTDETDIINVVIPGGDWKNLQSLKLECLLRYQVDAAYNPDPATSKVRLRVGDNVKIVMGADSGFWPASGIFVSEHACKLIRVDGSIYLYNGAPTGLGGSAYTYHMPFALTDNAYGNAWEGDSDNPRNATWEDQSFDEDIEIRLTMEWDTALEDNIIECLRASIVKV